MWEREGYSFLFEVGVREVRGVVAPEISDFEIRFWSLQRTFISFINHDNMYQTAYLFRIAKTISVFAIGVMSLLIVIGNITDYYSNFHFVEHVMKMDTIFPGSNLLYRSINSPFLHHAGYIYHYYGGNNGVLLFKRELAFVPESKK